MSPERIVKNYVPIPTGEYFHKSPAQMRCVVGPVGSGKTSMAAWEICIFIPRYLKKKFGIAHTRWVVVRNTYSELHDTTRRTLEEWFEGGTYTAQNRTYWFETEGYKVEILYRSCDRPDDMKKFKSLELTGYWVDESIEVDESIKRMLKNRIGRYPQKSPVRFGIETTNPPDVTHPTYSTFQWTTAPPGQPGPVYPQGPIPETEPLEKHEGFWQPPYENNQNLRKGYYDDLKNDYQDSPDWIDMYVEGRPGVLIQGKLVYANFRRTEHVAEESIEWVPETPLYLGWDHSGNTPACVVLQIPSAGRMQVLREYFSAKMGIVDFGNFVVADLNLRFPGATYVSYGDPAGAAQFSKKEGGFTSNSQILREECNINVLPSEQNFRARVEAVDKQLARREGLLIDPSCLLLVNGFLGGYCYPENKSLMGEYLPNVLKNKFSHPHDALQYILVQLNRHRERADLDPSVGSLEDDEMYGGFGSDSYEEEVAF